METENLSRLTGEVLEGNKEQISFKQMCLNCKWMVKNENGELICGNQENMAIAMEPVYEALKKVSGYDVTKLEVTPVPLKKPTSRCGRWLLSEEIAEFVKTLFV